MAPYRPAAEVVRQKDRKNPIQLKRNATGKREKSSRSILLQFRGKTITNPLHTGSYVKTAPAVWGHCLKTSRFHHVLTEEGQHEDAIVSYPQLVSVVKVIPCHKVVILHIEGGQDAGGLKSAQSIQQSQLCMWLLKRGPANRPALQRQHTREGYKTLRLHSTKVPPGPAGADPKFLKATKASRENSCFSS